MTNNARERSAIRPAWLLAAGAVIFSTSLVVASAPQGQKAKPAPPAKSPAAKAVKVPEPPVKDMTAEEEDAWATAAEETTNSLCSACHPIAEITRTRHTWPEWHDVVVRMAGLGVTATDEQLTTIKLYMTRYYGAVKVNTATAAELSAVLGLSSKDAAAIVEYRKAKGNFADAAALLKVEGIDTAKITEQAAALRFD
jgi:competence ComEA-like helix-hairpin-helix protein